MSLTDGREQILEHIDSNWANSKYGERPADVLAWDLADMGAPTGASEQQLRSWFKQQDKDTLSLVVIRIVRGTQDESFWFPSRSPELTASEFGQLEVEVQSSQYQFHHPAVFSYDAACLGAPPTGSWNEIWKWIRHLDRLTATRLSDFIRNGGLT